MTYKIIQDEDRLKEFINWLPNLSSNEGFYMCLMARKKYDPENIKGANGDKCALARFMTNKRDMFHDIQRLETKLESYRIVNRKTGEDNPCTQEALAMYMMMNPRMHSRAAYLLSQKILKLLFTQNIGYSLQRESMTALQCAKSQSRFAEFDFDDSSLYSDAVKKISESELINNECVSILKTRKGFHVIVSLDKLDPECFNKPWYKFIQSLGADDQFKVTEKDYETMESEELVAKLDRMLTPIPYTIQGMHMPELLNLNGRSLF